MLRLLVALYSLCVLTQSAPLVEQFLAREARAKNGFENGRSVGTVTATREASGLAASRKHPDVLYSLDDSGGKAAIYAISAKDGKTLATLNIAGSSNADWEDLAVGLCADGGGGYCIYIGDVGGNTKNKANIIYKVKEPSSIRSQTLQVASKFMYTWSQPNCESVMVDEKGEVYLISKVSAGNKAKLYMLPKSKWGSKSRVNIASIAQLPMLGSSARMPLVAADISPNGQEILVKAYNKLFYWKRRSGESVRNALLRRPIEVPVEKEPQGETVAWSARGNGYYTLSEGKNRPLYFYKRQ